MQDFCFSSPLFSNMLIIILFLPFLSFLSILQAKPSLADQNVIFVFVIGGINGLEVEFLNALISSIPLSIS